MSIDTEIPGEPATIEAAAHWLRNSLGTAVETAENAVADAKRDAGSCWAGDASDAFTGRMSTATTKVVSLRSAVRSAAADLDTFAANQRTRQSEMADARSTAQGAGLVVNDNVIEHPGPGPAHPGPFVNRPVQDPAQRAATAQARADHQDAVQAWQAHHALVTAYDNTASEVAGIVKRYAANCDSLQHAHGGLDHAAWNVNASDIAGAAAIATLQHRHVSVLKKEAAFRHSEAARWRERISQTDYRHPGGKDAFLRDAAHQTDAMDEAAKAARAADDAKLPFKVSGLGKVLGPAGVALGLYSDLADGESTTQAVASQGGALLAGVAVGAAVGSVIPGPGTAVGAAVGAIVVGGTMVVTSIFADGAIDSLFENGPDVGKAFNAGVDALEDTGEAIGDAGKAVGNTVKGWFS